MGCLASTVALLILNIFLGPVPSEDELHFDDGGVLKGRVVSQNSEGVVFAVTRASGAETVLKFKWHEIDRVLLAGASNGETPEVSDGRETPEVSDGGGDKKDDDQIARESKPVESVESVEQLIQGGWLDFASSAAVVPLRGKVGEDSLAHPWYVKWIIDQAKSQSVSLLIFELDTKGGYVASGQSIQDLLLETHGDLELGVWIKEAGSAGADIAASIPLRFVASTARIGASQSIVRSPDGRTVSEESVNQNADQRVVEKYASYSRAQHRVIEQKTGFPKCVLEAMSNLEAELWWSNANGFSSSFQAESRIVDGSDELLTFTGEEFYRYRLAQAQADTLGELIQHLPADTLDLRADISDAFSLLDAVFEEEDELVWSAVQHYFDAYDALLLSISEAISFFPSETFNRRTRLSSRDLQAFSKSMRDAKREANAALRTLKKCNYRRDSFFDFSSVCIIDFGDFEALVKKLNRIRTPSTLGAMHSALLELDSLSHDFDWCFEAEE